jgi:hypothetical protein
MSTSPEPRPPRPEYRLFAPNAVGLAAFLCSPLGGTILLAVNYVRMGKPRKGVLAVLYGAIASSLLILIRWHAHNLFASLFVAALAILFFLCTWQIATEIQGQAVEEHVAAGGQLASLPAALFVGIATLAAVLAIIYTIHFAMQPRKIITGVNDEVIYSNLATKSSATALGNDLHSVHYFENHNATVLLDSNLMDRTLSFVVPDGLWNQHGILSTFEKLARKAAPSIGGLPIEIQLLDSAGTVEAKSTVGEVRFHNDNVVYYQGEATQDEARDLGHNLESTPFFHARGATVLFIRHNGEGTILAFIVTEPDWTNPQKVAEFEAIAHDAAPEVGGLPIQLHLLNSQLELQKDELIEPQE